MLGELMSRVGRLAAASGLLVALTGCWPSTGADPDRRAFNGVETSVTTETVGGFVEAWTATTDGGSRGVSSAVVSAAGLVHVTTATSIYGFNSATGEQRWANTPYTGGGAHVDTEMTAVSDDGDDLSLYVSYGRSAMSWENGMFDPRTGFVISELFGRQESIRYGTEPVAAFTRFGARGDGVRQEVLTFPFRVGALTDHPGESRLTLGTSQIFHAGSGLMTSVPGDGTEGNGLRAFALEPWSNTCGAPGDQVFACPRWVLPLDGSSGTTPVLSADGATVYVGTDAGTFSAVDMATGAVRWSADLGSAVVAPPAVAPGTALVPTASGSLVALATDGCGASTCAPLWSSPTGSPLTVQPGAAGDVVFVGAADGSVDAFATAGCGAAVCAPVWSADTGSSITGAPAISNGRVFVGTLDGRLIAYGPPAV